MRLLSLTVKYMPTLNTTQLLLVFFAIGGAVAVLSPLAFTAMVLTMVVLGWKQIFIKSNKE